MQCNILRLKDLKPEKKPCYKTKYKNIVIVKLEKRMLFNNTLPNRSSIKH